MGTVLAGLSAPDLPALPSFSGGRFLVDTNILVYACNRDAPGHEPYRT